jgi:hypothetical protein
VLSFSAEIVKSIVHYARLLPHFMATDVPVLPTPVFLDYAVQLPEPHCLRFPPRKLKNYIPYRSIIMPYLTT